MSEEEMNELLKVKEETIERLTNMKDALKEKFKELKLENKKLKDEVEELKGKLESKKEGVEEKPKEGEEEDSVKKLMTQIKNGMFKLGQQNHTITQKVDQVLNSLSGGATISKSLGAGSQEESDSASH